MLKSLNVFLMVLFISGCSETVIPQTPIQFQTVSYAQLYNITLDVHNACQERVISKETCVDLFDNINSAKIIIDSGLGAEKAADILTYIRSKL